MTRCSNNENKSDLKVGLHPEWDFIRKGLHPARDFIPRRGFIRKGLHPEWDFIRKGLHPEWDFIPKRNFKYTVMSWGFCEKIIVL